MGHINPDVDGHYIRYQDLDAPYGYKIWAEYVKIEAPKLGNGKCPIEESGWYRTAKIPITKNESRNMDNLKNEYNFGSRMKVRLVNEYSPDEVLLVICEGTPLSDVPVVVVPLPPLPPNFILACTCSFI